MRILLLQLDSFKPNLALMRLSAHFKSAGHDVKFAYLRNKAGVKRRFLNGFFDGLDRIYASAIFEKSRPICEAILEARPDAIIGGSGWDEDAKLGDVGVAEEGELDYSLYPKFTASIAFSARGCRKKCPFCKVWRMEGSVREATPIEQVWRGDPFPKHIILLDNDFFGSKLWEHKIEYLRANNFKVCITQGINARLGTHVKYLSDENAAALASINYYDDDFSTRRLYTAWDNLKDEDKLFKGLEALKKYGVKPDHIMVYILIGYWPGESFESWEHRRAQLRAFGARPYPMPYVDNPETIGFKRWVIGAYDKKSNKNHIPWEKWEANNYRPEGIKGIKPPIETPLLDAALSG